MSSFVGIDVSSERLDVCISPSHAFSKFANSPAGVDDLVKWLAARVREDDLHLIIEPTSMYHQVVVQALIAQGIRYTLINPARTAMFARMQGRRAKADRVDARLLAEMGEQQRPEATQAGPQDQEELKAMRRHRQWLEQQATAAGNRLKTAQRSPLTPQAVLDSLERARKEMVEEAERIQRAIDEYVTDNQFMKASVDLLTTIPGVGQRTAVMLLSEMPPVERCPNAKTWVAFCGLNPEPRVSGNQSWSRLSRMGSARVRSSLYLAAVTALRWNPVIDALNDRLLARGKAGKVRAVAAMSQLVRICFGVLKNAQPFDPNVHRRHSLT